MLPYALALALGMIRPELGGHPVPFYGYGRNLTGPKRRISPAQRYHRKGKK